MARRGVGNEDTSGVLITSSSTAESSPSGIRPRRRASAGATAAADDIHEEVPDRYENLRARYKIVRVSYEGWVV